MPTISPNGWVSAPLRYQIAISNLYLRTVTKSSPNIRLFKGPNNAGSKAFIISLAITQHFGRCKNIGYLRTFYTGYVTVMYEFE